MQSIELLVIGAGPYGLAVAAQARRSGLDVAVVGEPMAFWKHHMPRGMLLRSGLDWHLDAAGVHSLEAFLEEKRIPRASAEPLPVEIFRGYAEWFRKSQNLDVQPMRVAQLHRVDGHFEARCEGGQVLAAQHVVATPGLAPFVHLPDNVAVAAAPGSAAHTSELVDFRPHAGKRCLIIGGRQSAFEWAALMLEQGAEAIHLSYRHETPRFVPSDWAFTNSMIESTLRTRGWFRRLSPAKQAAIHKHFWEEGRLKLEPWLWPRVNRANVQLWPNSRVKGCVPSAGGALHVHLDNGESFEVDFLLLATGYRVDLAKVPYLGAEIAAGRLRVDDGYPVLDEEFQTSLPGLYITGQAATRDFGPFFGFVRGCIASARIIVEGLKRRAAREPRASA
jgi:cation diffusion facilitator CzcD-associated flavoprotein CzcO